MMRRACLRAARLIALCAIAAPHAVRAQLWPSYLNNQGLSNQDLDIMNRETGDLYRSPDARIGQRKSWLNPASGNSGTATLVAMPKLRGMSCRRVRYDIHFARSQQSRTYSLNWCLTSNNEWRIVD
jgi:hypothetical protein